MSQGKVEYSKLSLIWLMIWHMTWRLGQADLNYKIINLPNIKTYKYTHLTKCLQSAFYFHNYSVKPSIKFLFTKYRVNKFINQWQTHRFTRTSIIFYSNLWLLEPSIPQLKLLKNIIWILIESWIRMCRKTLSPAPASLVTGVAARSPVRRGRGWLLGPGPEIEANG